MRVLLTGANGFIGRHLLQALLADGHHVVCTLRRPRTSTEPRLACIHSDFAQDTDKSVWLARLKDVDAVINTGGYYAGWLARPGRLRCTCRLAPAGCP